MSDFHDRAPVPERKARMWLCAGLGVHVLTLVLTVFAALQAGTGPALHVGIAISLAALPLCALLWYERGQPSRNRPDSWPRRAVIIALPQAVGFAMASSELLAPTALVPWQRAVLLAAVPLLLQTGAAVAALRAVRRPLSPELGGTDLEVRVKLRSNRAVPRWLSAEDVRLTDHDLVVVVQPGPTWRAMMRLALVDVTAVDARPSTAGDDPWLILDDGHGYGLAPGDVVVVDHRQGRQILPTYDAHAFADVLRLRVEKVRRATEVRSGRGDSET